MQTKKKIGKILNVNIKHREKKIVRNALRRKLLAGGKPPPTVFSLEQTSLNTPNPNPNTRNPNPKKEFQLSHASNEKFPVYNVVEQKVIELFNSRIEVKRYSYLLNANNVITQIYFSELEKSQTDPVKTNFKYSHIAPTEYVINDDRQLKRKLSL